MDLAPKFDLLLRLQHPFHPLIFLKRLFELLYPSNRNLSQPPSFYPPTYLGLREKHQKIQQLQKYCLFLWITGEIFALSRKSFLYVT